MKRLTATLAAGVAFTLLLSACGSSGGSSANKGTNTSAASAQASGAPFVLGTVCSCSGAQSSAIGAAQQAANAWASWTNDNGGINGHPVKLIVKDDGGNPATALQAVKELVEQEHVMAIVGETSLVDSTWASYIAGTGVPVVGGLSIEPPFATNANFFPVGSSTAVLQVGEFAEVNAEGLKKWGEMYCAESPICAQLDQLSQLAAQLTGGKTTVTTAAISATAPSYNAQCLKMQSAGVDALSIAHNATVAARVLAQCVQLGYKPRLFNQAETFGTNWLTDKNFEGMTLISPAVNYTDTSIPGVKTFLDALNKYSPSVTKSESFSYVSFFPWLGGQLFAAAAKAGKLTPTSTSADVKSGLYALKGETLGGLTPPLTFKQGEPTLVDCYFTLDIKAGALVSRGTTPQCLTSQQLSGVAAALKAAG